MDPTPQIYSPVFNKQDKNFLYSINSFIEEELAYLSYDDISKERFLIYKQALNKILEYVQAYKGLLGSIKKEYESCINTLEKGQNETEKVRLELNKTVTHPVTLLNLQKRKDELLAKIDILNSINESLNNELKQKINENKKFRPETLKPIKKYFFLNYQQKQKQAENVVDDIKPLIPGLDMNESTDLEFLNELLEKVEKKIKDLNLAKSISYSTKSRKHDLKELLFSKIIIRDNLQSKNDALKRKVYLYKLAMNATKEYYDGNSQYSSILDALTKSIINGALSKQVKLDEDGDQEDHLLESEAEFILDYIDKFNDLFVNGDYKEASFFAAASPRGVLRNIETMHRFKSVCNVELGDNDPLLLYCTALLDSINGNISVPDETMSFECIKIAIAHEKIDLLTRWIAERRLRFTYAAAKCIEEYVELKAKFTKKGLELALFMYTQINAVYEAATCMAKLGRFTAMIEYISQNEEYKSNTDVFLNILRECPDVNYATLLAESEKFKNSIKIEQIVSILLDSAQPSNGLKFLKLQIDRLPADNTQNLDENSKDEIEKKKEKLKASYHTLNKFAFLAENESKMDEKTINELKNSIEELKLKIGDTTTNEIINENLRHIIEEKRIINPIEFVKLNSDNSNSDFMESTLVLDENPIPTVPSNNNFIQNSQVDSERYLIDNIYDSSIINSNITMNNQASNETIQQDMYKSVSEDLLEGEENK